jgi:indolepyruvate ferredoxin oxidoreductase
VAQLVARRVEFLTGYQNAAYARSYSAFVERVRQAEAPLGKTALAEAVARNLFKLMAYKDEYEVARLHTDPAFHQKIAAQFEGDYTLRCTWRRRCWRKRTRSGELVKRQYGPWMFKALASAGEA